MEIKKLLSLILLTVTVGIGFSSCSNDEENEPNGNIKQIIVGEWDSEWLGEASEINTIELNVDDTRLHTVDSRLVFISNGKGYEIDLYDGIKTEFTYTIKGEIIRMSAGNVTQTYKIIKYSHKVVYILMESEQLIFKIVKRF